LALNNILVVIISTLIVSKSEIEQKEPAAALIEAYSRLFKLTVGTAIAEMESSL